MKSEYYKCWIGFKTLKGHEWFPLVFLLFFPFFVKLREGITGKFLPAGLWQLFLVVQPLVFCLWMLSVLASMEGESQKWMLLQQTQGGLLFSYVISRFSFCQLFFGFQFLEIWFLQGLQSVPWLWLIMLLGKLLMIILLSGFFSYGLRKEMFILPVTFLYLAGAIGLFLKTKSFLWLFVVDFVILLVLIVNFFCRRNKFFQ